MKKIRLRELLTKLRNTGFFNIFGSSVLAKAITFLSSIVLVRLVSKSRYGIFTYSWNIYSIATLFSGLGMISATLQICCEKSGNEKEKNDIYSYGMRAGTFVNLFLCLVLLLIGLFFPFKMEGVKLMLCLLAALPILQYWNDYQTAYLRIEKRTKAYASLNVLNVLLVFLFSIVGAIFIQEKGFVISRYIAYAVLVFVGYRVCRIPFHWRGGALPIKQKADLWQIATVSMVNTGISQMLYLLDVFVLGAVIPDSSVVASYKVGTIIPTALSFIPGALVIYLYPYFAENRRNSKWCLQKYKLILLGMGSVNLMISTILVVFAPFIIKLMYGAQYLDAVVPFRILSVSYFFSGTFRVIAGNLLVTQRKLGYNTFVAVISGAVNVIADVVLITKMGSAGAAWATLAVVLLTSVLNVSYLLYTFSKAGKDLG